MTIVDCTVIALLGLALVIGQVVATRRYGGWGLICASGMAIAIVFGAGAIYEAWMPWKRAPQDEFGFGHGFFLGALTLGNLLIVLVTAVLLAGFAIRDD